MEKEYIDINHEIEFPKLYKEINLLNNRLTAISIDYKNYFTKNFVTSENSKIFSDMCSSLSFRLNCSTFHLELLCREIDLVEQEIQNINEKHFSYLANNSQNFNYIFDSIIYHVTSLYDYIGSIINFIQEKKQEFVKWNSIVQKHKNKKDQIYALTYKFHREFVDNLFKIRSKLIHDKVLLSGTTYSQDYFNVRHSFEVPTNRTILKHFGELQNLSNNYDISLKYTSFYLIRQTIEYLTEILFELKKYMEANKATNKLAITVIEDGIHVSGSKIHWFEHLREK